MGKMQIEGKYNTTTVFTDNIEETAIQQIQDLMNQEWAKKSKVVIMPDVHAGAGCTIGTTMTIEDKICPNLVGVDIGCGMLVQYLGNIEIDYGHLDSVIRHKIPSGFSIRTKSPVDENYSPLKKLKCFDHIDLKRAMLSIGTLGGGNHFIEIDEDEDSNKYLVIHTGSRHLGLEVAKYYQDKAIKQVHKNYKEKQDFLIKVLKEASKETQIQEFMEISRNLIPADSLCYLEGELAKNYLHDMQLVQDYACQNRKNINYCICYYMDWLNQYYTEEDFTTIHNYIDIEKSILRKGAVSAQAGERLIIPMNMRDGSLICIGKGNPDWNFSAPHGAGRIMSRAAAKANFSMKQFQEEMQDIWSSTVNSSTLDEAPMAYKPMQEIIDNIQDTVEIEKIIIPKYNFKAAD